MDIKKEVNATEKFEPIVFVNNPITHEKDDIIGFESQVETLNCAIKNGANMIGIIADYGTGKSSLSELLSKSVANKKRNKTIKINMWDCLNELPRNTDKGNNEEQGVSLLTKSFLYQLSKGHDLKFSRYINKLMSRNYGNILFSTNNNRRFIKYFFAAGLFFVAYKILGISGTGVMQYIDVVPWLVPVLKCISPALLFFAIFIAILGLKNTIITFSHWKMPNRKAPEINDVYDVYDIITEKIVPRRGKRLIFVEDLDRIEDKKLIVDFLKELYRFQDTLCEKKTKLVFIISVKPESQLTTVLNATPTGATIKEASVYSKIFDITLSLKPIHFDDYDSLLYKLIKSNKQQEYDLARLIGRVDKKNNPIPFEEKLPSDFYWIKKGTNLTLRDIKTRLNQSIAIMISLKNKDYKVTSAIDFKPCAAVAYLENKYEREYYNLIKSENEFSQFMQSTISTLDKESDNDTQKDTQKILIDSFKNCFALNTSKDGFIIEDKFSLKFITDFCDMLLSGIFNDDYRMYFYTYPKGSHIKTTDERILCNYIQSPNLYNKHDNLDELVTRVYKNGKNNIVSGIIKNTEEYPSVLIENPTLFLVATDIDLNKSFAIFAKNVVNTNCTEAHRIFLWKMLLALPKDLYESFVKLIATDIISKYDDSEQLLALRYSIVRSIPDKILDFAELYSSTHIECAPLITKNEIDCINNIENTLKLIDIKNLDEDNFNVLANTLNLVELKTQHSNVFSIACEIWKTYASILDEEQIANKLLEFLSKNKYLNDDFFKIICDSSVALENIAEYLILFDSKEFSEQYLESINNLGFDDFIRADIVKVLLNKKLFYTPLLYISNKNLWDLLDDISYLPDEILEVCKKINNDFPEKIELIRNHFYFTKKIAAYKKLYFAPFSLIKQTEFLQFEDTIDAINLIDTTQIDEKNYQDIINTVHKRSYVSDELVYLFEWLFNLNKNDDCISESLLKKSIVDSFDFNILNIKTLNETQREKVHECISDVMITNTPEDALELLKKYGCLIPSVEKLVTETEDDDVLDSYYELIAKYNEFSSYTLTWLKQNYITCDLPGPLCEILFAEKDYENYIIASSLRHNNMIIDENIPFSAYFDVYMNADKMFDLMSGHNEFLEILQETEEFTQFDETYLRPMFKTKQSKRFFEYILSDSVDDSLKKEYLKTFGKFKSEQDSNDFQVSICKPENIELLDSYDYYYHIREQLWDSQPARKGVFTKKWNKRWQKELENKMISID